MQRTTFSYQVSYKNDHKKWTSSTIRYLALDLFMLLNINLVGLLEWLAFITHRDNKKQIAS